MEGKRGGYEQDASFCFSPSEISASFHAGVITPSSSFFSLSSFRADYPFSSFSFSFLLSHPVSRPIPNLVSYTSFAPYARRRGGRAVTSVADFRLECSHLESVFSCTEPVDIFSQQTSISPGIFRRFFNEPEISSLLLENLLRNWYRSIVDPLFFKFIHLIHVAWLCENMKRELSAILNAN